MIAIGKSQTLSNLFYILSKIPVESGHKFSPVNLHSSVKIIQLF
jgi:hypothetical protein